MCLIDLRGLIADLFWSSGGGASCRSFPFNEGEVEVNARARRAAEGILVVGGRFQTCPYVIRRGC